MCFTIGEDSLQIFVIAMEEAQIPPPPMFQSVSGCRIPVKFHGGRKWIPCFSATALPVLGIHSLFSCACRTLSKEKPEAYPAG